MRMIFPEDMRSPEKLYIIDREERRFYLNMHRSCSERRRFTLN
jgi:hypothetical protein